MRRTAMTVAAVLGLGGHAWAQDPPAYDPQPNLSGSVTWAGSDTERELLDAWGQAFERLHPDVEVAGENEGSATAPPALVEGSATLGAMSRAMTDDEAALFEDAKGHAPTPITVALDALAVFVRNDNPVQGLTIEQLDGIFSSDDACGGGAITTWGQLALGVPDDTPIKTHGRDERSGTHDTFQEKALCGGAFKDDVEVHPDSADVVAAVAADPAAIGYAGLGYDTPEVRPLAIGAGSDFEDMRFIPYIVEEYADSPDPEEKYAYVVDGRYPLSRPLLLYVDKVEGEPLPEPTASFVRFALSREGQTIVEQIGFVPLPDGAVADEAAKLDPDYRPRRWWFF